MGQQNADSIHTHSLHIKEVLLEPAAPPGPLCSDLCRMIENIFAAALVPG